MATRFFKRTEGLVAVPKDRMDQAIDPKTLKADGSWKVDSVATGLVALGVSNGTEQIALLLGKKDIGDLITALVDGIKDAEGDG